MFTLSSLLYMDYKKDCIAVDCAVDYGLQSTIHVGIALQLLQVQVEQKSQNSTIGIRMLMHYQMDSIEL